MKLFITGGTGFFGRSMLRYLQTQFQQNPAVAPAEVVVLSRSPDRFLAEYPEFTKFGWLQLHRGDVEDPASLPQRISFTHILHAAADSTDAAGMTPLQRHEQIVQGTKNILQLAATTGARRFLLTSSGGVYGPQPASVNSIPETHNGIPDPLSLSSVYGLAKRQAEHLSALYSEAHGFEYVIARCFAFVGPDLPRHAHFAIGNFIRDALECPKISVSGDGTPIRTYLYQDDLAEWLLTALLYGQHGQAYNVGSDETTSIAELAHLVRDILAPGKAVNIFNRSDNSSHRNRYVPDITKAKTELGLRVKIDLAEAIRRVGQSLHPLSEE